MGSGLESRGEREALRATLIAAALAVVVVAYLASTLPYLADFPRPSWAEMGIAAPAYKLASEGVYGNDLFAGFHRSEERNYEYMPAYPLLVAVSFELFGLGVRQARWVSIGCGLLTLLFTFWLGRTLRGCTVGLAAAASLVFVRLGLAPLESGVPLLDLARVIRYDILVPVFVLASSIAFCSGLAAAPGAGVRFVLAGLLCAFAGLSHVYGAFLLAPMLLVLLWEQGWTALRRRQLMLILGGLVLGLLPWLLYVLQDPAAYLGQMSRHEGRFELLDPRFYWNNLRHEHWRYARWGEGGVRAALLQPRVGIWLFLLGVPAAWIHLALDIRRRRRTVDRFLLLALPVLALLLGLLMLLKRYQYVLLVLPFIALYIGVSLVSLWRFSGTWRGGRPALLLVLALGVGEAATGVAQSRRAAAGTTPYQQVTERLVDLVPAGARVLLSQPYWLGLARYETRSVNLILQLAGSSSTRAALQQVNPDYVILESYFLDPDSPDPRRIDRAHRFFPWFQTLRRELERQCPERHDIDSFADYGEIRVYRCEIAGP